MSHQLNPDQKHFNGVWTAIITPFGHDLQIDWSAFEKLMTQQADAGVTGVVIAGTTGESPTLAVQEKLSLIRKARAIVGSRIRIMAGSGDNNTHNSVELSRLCRDAGADSLLIVTPPYNKPSLRGLVAHYKAIRAAVDVPLCLYHVPGRTAQFLTVQQLREICQEAGIACVKEASGDVGYFSRVVNATGIPILSGDDPTYLPSLAVGGKGTISVVSNVFPKAMVHLTEAWKAGNNSLALRLHNRLLIVADALFCEVNPGPVKCAMSLLYGFRNTLRLPLEPVTEESFERIRSVVTAAKSDLEREGHA